MDTKASYYLRNKERYLAQAVRWKHEHRERWKAYAKQWNAEHKPQIRASQRKNYQKLRRETILAYGDRCVCCGEAGLEFLSLDHVHGNGKAHRFAIGRTDGTGFYQGLKKLGYPKDGTLQVLCMNCNWAKGMRGVCPHQAKA
jgi:hypothetical protein